MTENKTITPERLLELADQAKHKLDMAQAYRRQASSYEGKQGHDGETVFSVAFGLARARYQTMADDLESEANGLARTAVKEGAPLDIHMVFDDATYFVIWKYEGKHRFVFEDLPRTEVA